MELLVEFIVWVFKVLFGEQEKTVDVHPSRRRESRPMSGGDANRPKTLEEILQEVRRQAAERQGQPPAPRPPPVSAAPPLPPLVQRPFTPPPAPPRPVPQAQPRPVSRQAPSVEGREAWPAQILKPRQAQPGNIRPPVQPKPVRAPSIPVAPVEETADERQRAMPSTARRAKGQAQAAGPELVVEVENPFAILQAIRTAPPEAKRLVARQAVVLTEVFGPPLSRRRRAIGRGMF